MKYANTQLRIPLIADTHSRLIADSVPGDHGVAARMTGHLSAINLERCPRSARTEGCRVIHAAIGHHAAEYGEVHLLVEIARRAKLHGHTFVFADAVAHRASSLISERSTPSLMPQRSP